jgi:hypothetical protein
MAQEYPIPRCLWESLDAVLYSKGVSLAKDIAKELKVPVQPLLGLLNKEEGAKFVIAPDDSSNTYQCQATIQNGTTLMRCRSATLGLVAKFCVSHERSLNDVPSGLQIVQRIISPDGIYMAKGSEVYRLNGTRCGLLHGTRLTLFQLDA